MWNRLSRVYHVTFEPANDTSSKKFWTQTLCSDFFQCFNASEGLSATLTTLSSKALCITHLLRIISSFFLQRHLRSFQ